jgi:hypothetical protein
MKEDPMKLTRITALTVALLIACVAVATAGKYSEKTLIGTWDFDMVKIMKASGAMDQLPPGMDVEQMMKDMYMRITFKKDHTFVFETKTPMNEVSELGKWEMVKAEGDKVTIKSISEEGKEQLFTMVFTDKDNFDTTAPDNEKMTMSATRNKDKDKEEEKKEG